MEGGGEGGGEEVSGGEREGDRAGVELDLLGLIVWAGRDGGRWNAPYTPSPSRSLSLSLSLPHLRGEVQVLQINIQVNNIALLKRCELVDIHPSIASGVLGAHGPVGRVTAQTVGRFWRRVALGPHATQ